MIVLPGEGLGGEEIELMIVHEMAHLRRRDLWWNWLLTVVMVVFWFHPLAWVGRRGWGEAMEMACDEETLAVTGASPVRYGEMLLALARGREADRVLGAGMAHARRGLLRRLSAMKTGKRWTRRRAAAVMGALAVAAGAGLAPWRVAVRGAEGAGAAGASAAPAGAGAPDAISPQRVLPVGAGELRVMGTVIAPVVELRAPVDGTLIDIDAKEGSAVKQGEVLFRFDDTELRGALAVAQAKLQQAKADLSRLQQNGNAVAPADVEHQQTEVRLAEVDVEMTQRALEQTRIVSPIDGVMDACTLTKGATITKGTLLTKVVGTGELGVKMDVSVDWAKQLRVGAPITMEGGVVGEVTFISPLADPSTRSVEVHGKITSGGSGLLPGEGVSVLIGGKGAGGGE
jgi:multidrug efflux pump subunit AcrA (membrane-fusion protein)